MPHRFISSLPAQLPPARCPVTGERSPLRSVKINRFEAFKACFQHLLPLTYTQARPANAPTHNTALGMDTEMFEGSREAVTYTRTALPRIQAEPLKATLRCKEQAKGSQKLGNTGVISFDARITASISCSSWDFISAGLRESLGSPWGFLIF